jgi:LysM repeat protein
MSPDAASHPSASADPGKTPTAGKAAPEPPVLVPAGACPFLIAAAGAYRMSIPDREHRCAAFVPATSLALSKQSRLCLTPNHAGCATYIASTSARQARIGAGERLERSGRWGFARTMPVVEEVGGLRATVAALLGDRRTWPAIPAVLLASLLLALGLSGSWSQGPVTSLSSLSPSSGARRSPTPTSPASTSPATTPPSTGPRPSEAPPSGPPSTAPPPTPGPTPAASATLGAGYATYTVKANDTLYDLAQTFGTTVGTLERLNGLTSTNLHIGQVLTVPKT